MTKKTCDINCNTCGKLMVRVYVPVYLSDDKYDIECNCGVAKINLPKYIIHKKEDNKK